jgi:hypothetical protein
VPARSAPGEVTLGHRTPFQRADLGRREKDSPVAAEEDEESIDFSERAGGRERFPIPWFAVTEPKSTP